VTWQPPNVSAIYDRHLHEVLRFAATTPIVLSADDDCGHCGGVMWVDDDPWITGECVRDLGDLLQKTGEGTWTISDAGRARLADLEVAR